MPNLRSSRKSPYIAKAASKRNNIVDSRVLPATSASTMSSATASSSTATSVSMEKKCTSKYYDLSFSKPKEQLNLLEALFNYGCQSPSFELPPSFLNLFPDVSLKTLHCAIQDVFENLEAEYENKPSIAYWMRSGLFNEDPCIPLALLCIEWFERYLMTKECNFREIYRFLYEVTMNRPPTRLSQKSAKVLYTILSDIFDKAWPNTQQEILDFFSETYQYNRSMNRRTYSGKRKPPQRRKI